MPIAGVASHGSRPCGLRLVTTQRSVTSPPGSVNLTAFDSRLSTICCSFSASARTCRPRAQRRRCAARCRLPAPAAPPAPRSCAGSPRRRHRTSVVPHVPALDARVVQHAVDQAEQVPLAALDARERVRWSRVTGPWMPDLDQLRVAGDRVERCAQLVRHHRQELALRLARRLRQPRGWRARIRAAARARARGPHAGRWTGAARARHSRRPAARHTPRRARQRCARR